MRYLLLWMVWLASTMAWACLCLSLFLGRTTPLMLSRWWLLGLAIVLTFSLTIRLSFLVYLRRAMGNTGTVFAAQSRAALTDIPFAATLPLLALVNLSDSMNHYLSSIPLLQCTVLLAPIVAAAVVHEALLNRLAPHSDSALSKDPVLAPRSRAIMQESLAVMLLVGLALLFFWPTFTGRVPIPVDLNYHVPPWNSLVDSLPSVNNPVPSDALWLAYPYAHFRYQAADSSLVPLWNPHTFAGAPYLAEPNTQALQPLHFLFTRLLPATALTVITVLYFALAGIGMYAFIRTIRLPRGAALLGAITFMFGSFVSMWLQLTYLMASIAWLLPLTLLGMELILRGKYRWGSLVAGSSLGVALFGSPQLAIYIVMAGVLYTTWMMIAQWIQGDQSPRRLFTRAVIVAGSALLALGIAAAQIIPSLELTQLSQRAASSSAIAANSLPTPQLLTILLPGIMGYPPDNTTWGGSNLLEATLYVGILPLLLASWATWTCNNRYLIFWRWLDSVEHSLGARLAAGASSLSGVSAISSLSILGPHSTLIAIRDRSAYRLWSCIFAASQAPLPKPSLAFLRDSRSIAACSGCRHFCYTTMARSYRSSIPSCHHSTTRQFSLACKYRVVKLRCARPHFPLRQDYTHGKIRYRGSSNRI